jgi:hypothetical protein
LTRFQWLTSICRIFSSRRIQTRLTGNDYRGKGKMIMMSLRGNRSLKLFLAVCLGVAILPGANPLAATVADIALLKSPGREKILVEGAKKEGKVTFYTGLIVDQVVRPLKEAFEKDYPFIQLDFFRGNSERVAQKMLLEYQAKRFDVDLISGSGSTTMIQQAGFMQRFYSPPLAEYPAELKDLKGFGRAATFIS